jgi:lysine-specific demethylase/histidyl-hydroxylase NO66
VSLSRLVTGSVDFDDFWEAKPLLSRDLGGLDDVLSPELLEELIVEHGLRKPFFRMIKNGPLLPTAAYTRSIGSGATALNGVVDPRGVRDCLAGGATLVVTGLRLYLASVTRFCDLVSDDLGFPVHANAYLTPAQSRGAGAHYDFHSVFIRQVWGRKFWSIQAPVEELPHKRCPEGAQFDTPVVLETWLEPGDCLYLPRGYIHDGWTEDRASLHLTFSMPDPQTWADIIVRELRTRALEQSAELRSVLPMRFADNAPAVTSIAAERLKLIRGILDELEADEVATSAIRRFEPETWDIRQSDGFRGFLDVLEPNQDDTQTSP